MLPFTKGASRCVEPTRIRDRRLAMYRWRTASRRTIRCGPSGTSPITLERLLAQVWHAVYPVLAGRRCRRRSCCGPCCCRCLYRSAASGSCGASGLQPAVSAGLSAWGSMIRCGIATLSRKNRDRLLAQRVMAGLFIEAVLLRAMTARLAVRIRLLGGRDVLQAWAVTKSFRPRDGSDDQRPAAVGGNRPGCLGRRPRNNDTVVSTTDPDARTLSEEPRTASHLSYQGHVLMEHRTALVVSATVTGPTAWGAAMRHVAMLEAVPGRSPRDRRRRQGLRHRDFVPNPRACTSRHMSRVTDVPPRGSAIDGRTTRHPGYTISQQKRARPTGAPQKKKKRNTSPIVGCCRQDPRTARWRPRVR